MTIISFSELRNNVRAILKKMADERAPITVRLRNNRSFVIMTQEDYDSLQETLYLLSNPANAERLRRAVEDFENGKRNYQAHDLIEVEE